MKLWFYIENSEQKGPVEKAALIELLKSGQLKPDTLVWTHYMQDWTRASEVDDLKRPTTSAPPPTPGPSAPATLEESGYDTGQSTAQPTDQPTGQPGYAPSWATETQEPVFFHISGRRLVLMSIATWGIFELYWIFRNWQYLKERDGLKIHPFWRGVFSIFFIHKLMNTIHDDPQANRSVKATFPPSVLATVWVILLLVGNISSKAADPMINLVGLVVSFPSFLLFLPVQRYINAVNRQITPTPPYTGWSAGQYACLALGVFIWLFILAAILAPPA